MLDFSEFQEKRLRVLFLYLYKIFFVGLAIYSKYFKNWLGSRGEQHGVYAWIHEYCESEGEQRKFLKDEE